MKNLFIVGLISILTTACSFFGLLPGFGKSEEKIEQYRDDLHAITAEADSSSAVVDSALYRTKGYVQVVSIEAQFQSRQVNRLMNIKKTTAPIR